MKEGERILNTISRDIWAPAVLIKKKKKAFIAYSAFVWILQAVKPQQNEKLERVSPGLCAFYILVAFVLR